MVSGGGRLSTFQRPPGMVLLPKISTSILSELSFRQLSFIQLAMLVMHPQKLVLAVVGFSESERRN